MTYSIVARDSTSGQLGVAAVASGHGVGRAVTWVLNGAGAVATQADLSAGFGRKALALLRNGEMNVEQIVAELLRQHKNTQGWQVAVLGGDGQCGAHTGDLCLPYAGHRLGTGYSVQGNMMATQRTWDLMADAYERSTGDLADRMLCALRAGHEVGGDIRGDRSAAMLIANPDSVEADLVADFRVDWSTAPTDDLAILTSVDRAYREYIAAFGRLLDGDAAQCAVSLELLGDAKPEWVLMRAVALAADGDVARARSLVQVLFEREPTWREVARRFASTEVASTHPQVAALLRAASQGFLF